MLSVGDLDPAVVAIREFLHRTGAVEVQGVVDRGTDEPALVTFGRATPIEVTEGGRTVHLPHGVELDVPVPSFRDLPQLPPFDLDPGEGTVTGPLGAVQSLAEGVSDLAEALGGRSVALAFYATTNAETPLGIAGRAGETPVLTIGDEQFALPG